MLQAILGKPFQEAIRSYFSSEQQYCISMLLVVKTVYISKFIKAMTFFKVKQLSGYKVQAIAITEKNILRNKFLSITDSLLQLVSSRNHVIL